MEAVRSYRGVNSELTHPVSPALGRLVDQAVLQRQRTLSGLAAELYQRFSRWRQMARTLRALNRLDDHGLADIGLRRADLRNLLEMRLRRRR